MVLCHSPKESQVWLGLLDWREVSVVYTIRRSCSKRRCTPRPAVIVVVREVCCGGDHCFRKQGEKKKKKQDLISEHLEFWLYLRVGVRSGVFYSCTGLKKKFFLDFQLQHQKYLSQFTYEELI